MLDFYLISDNKKTNPKSPKNLKYAGGIEDDKYYRLIRIGLIDEKYDYYSDFRWNTAVVKQINKHLEKYKTDNNTDIETLRQIINQAVENNCGLIAYCD